MSGRAVLHFEFAIFLGILVAVFLFAAWKGDQAERLGGAFNLIAGLIASAIGWFLHGGLESTLQLSVDAALAAGFLYLALRFASLWVGLALLLQAVQFSLHAFYLVSDLPRDLNYKIINNLDTDGINLCIVFGTALAWRRRARARPASLSSSPAN
ncbi:MAG TPA: hypothetical protein VGS12_11495 [Caulobacteraceae bacterium]|nr:hypothetical protein [Caulobacteraceae bacterium]